MGSWYIKSTLYNTLSNWNKIFKKNKSYWQNLKMLRFQSYYFQLISDTPLFWKRFSFFRKLDSKLNYWKCSTFPVIVTEKRADLSNGGRSWKLLAPLFGKSYALSFGFKIKSLRKSVYLCYDKHHLKFSSKACWKEHPFILCVLDELSFSVSVLLNMWQ